MEPIILNGITWGHSRGITPLLAAAQRFTELYPQVTINWKKRTLQEFADFPIEKLTEQYDLLIIDHPWVGKAAAMNCVLPLDQHLSAEYLQDQADHSVGDSHISYNYGGHQWALAIDAATPAASYRADLLKAAAVAVPETWDDVLDLAKQGRVAAPAIPIDCLMNFYMFCIAHGKEPFLSKDEVIDADTGVKAMQTMYELYSLLPRDMFSYNPIAVAEVMSRADDYWYCPFAYCYSNYSRDGYAAHRLMYSDLVTFGGGQRLRSTIGGTGLSVSAYSKHPEMAVRFAEWIVSGELQATFYTEHGGQPGHRKAWTDERANTLTHDFFRNVLPTMDNGYMRPRYNGYLHFQDEAGEPLQHYLMHGGDPLEALKTMNRIYTKSQLKSA